MKSMKSETALGVALAILIAGGLVTAILLRSGKGERQTPQEIVEKSKETYASLTGYRDTGRIVAQFGGQTATYTFGIRLQRPNFYRVQWTNSMEASPAFLLTGVVWSDGRGDYMSMSAPGHEQDKTKFENMQTALAAATGVSGQASAHLPGTFFQQPWGDVFRALNVGQARLERLNDAVINGVHCWVVSSSLDPANLPIPRNLPGSPGKLGLTTTTLWIGREDHLIHQIETTIEAGAIVPPQLSDADVKKMLENEHKTATPEEIAARKAEFEEAMKQAKSRLQSGKITFTETHSSILVNPKFSAGDFAE